MRRRHRAFDALNNGFKLATGDILGFLNADDLLLPGSLAKMVREFRLHTLADVVSGHGYLANESGKVGAPFVSDRWKLTRFAYDACMLEQAATFFRRAKFRQKINMSTSPRSLGWTLIGEAAWPGESSLAIRSCFGHTFIERLGDFFPPRPR